MTVMTGTVEAISEKEGKFGPMISYKINGDWMLLKGAKFKPRDIAEGSTVEVNFSTNDRGYKDIEKGGLKLAAVAPSTATVPATGKTAAVPYKDPRQTIISTQAALNTAIAFVTVAAANGVLPSFGNAKANDKLALFRNWVLSEAAGFYHLSTGETLDTSAFDQVADAELPVKPKVKKPAAKIETEYEDDTGTDEYEDA